MLHTTETYQPLVSVIIPTYNRPEYLKQAIASAVQQTYQNIEIIVCDNCSSVNPQPIVDAFDDSRIRFWRNSQNLGMVANIINGFKMARGKYVASLHDDDIWEKNFLEKLVPPLEADSNLALAFCDHYMMNADSEIDYAHTEYCSQVFKRDNLKEGVYQPFYEQGIVDMSVASVVAAVIRKDVVDWDAFPVEAGGCYDLYLNYLCCRSGLGAYYYPERLARFRTHAQSDTRTDDAQVRIRKANNQIFCYEQFIKDARLHELHPYFHRRLLEARYSLGMSLLQAKQPIAARSHFWHVIKNKKRSLRSIGAMLLTFMPQSFTNRALDTNKIELFVYK
ncbi:glycosyltransferase family 2 protein [Hassallia byssoidea VB512170]|uniref:Glycosyltransferase family 2 protein n=1 Tax=Hassallia byssoidea VB512170 TaxID=1304833 RepID=A0A846H3M7_9CYAN|nr:glycosyltransferase family 2 protein [Hassalia byssoidea]NEU71171.1 glycosyltransferase family 2 protein [Hassalia byssoidea VB512170]